MESRTSPAHDPLCVIGVDGGGTKTIAVLMDSSGHVAGRAAGGPSNYQTSGTAAVEDVLRATIEAAAAGPADDHPVRVAALCLGMAGMDSPDDHAALQTVAQALIARPPAGVRWAAPPQRQEARGKATAQRS